MPPFSVNPTRIDPYKGFKFRVIWDGRTVAGISKVSALKRVTEVVKHRDGSSPSALHKSPGTTDFEPVTLERGLTHDSAFEDWVNQVWNFSNTGPEISLGNFRKDVTLQLLNEAGQVAIAYNLFRCWPSEAEMLPDLDSNGNATAIQRIVLQNEGWVRDTAVQEPEEPTSGR